MKQLPFSDAKKAYAILGTYSLLEHESAKTDTLNGTRRFTEILVVRKNDSPVWLIRGSAMS